MKFRPIYNQLVVKAVEADNTTASGLFVMTDAVDEPNKGLVLAVGEGARNKDGNLITMTVKVNDRVLFTKGLGQKVKVDGEEYIVLKEDELLGTYED